MLLILRSEAHRVDTCIPTNRPIHLDKLTCHRLRPHDSPWAILSMVISRLRLHAVTPPCITELRMTEWRIRMPEHLAVRVNPVHLPHSQIP